jgi:hypothetical protein
MPVEKLPRLRGISGEPINSSATAPLEFLRADCLYGEAHRVDHEPFQQGYVAGWRSVRGADDHPVLIPPSPVFVGPAMYMVGFSRGARDAGAMTTVSGES